MQKPGKIANKLYAFYIYIKAVSFNRWNKLTIGLPEVNGSISIKILIIFPFLFYLHNKIIIILIKNWTFTFRLFGLGQSSEAQDRDSARPDF